jgi:uncharacterized membrane protein
MDFTLSKHRIEGLTDGIFAIVMTLIVLELKIPELERHASNVEIIAKIRELGPQLLAFLLTFALSAMFWFLHHSSMHFIRHMNRPLILINLLFLLFVSLLPFSAALLGRYPRAPIALQIYYGHQFVLGALLLVQWECVERFRLFVEDMSRAERIRLPWRLRAIPLGCLAALVTAFFAPLVAQQVFLAAVVLGRLISRLRERAAAAAA